MRASARGRGEGEGQREGERRRRGPRAERVDNGGVSAKVVAERVVRERVVREKVRCEVRERVQGRDGSKGALGEPRRRGRLPW